MHFRRKIKCLGGSESQRIKVAMSTASSISQSINQEITTFKSDQWRTTHLKTKIKLKHNVQKVKTTQR